MEAASAGARPAFAPTPEARGPHVCLSSKKYFLCQKKSETRFHALSVVGWVIHDKTQESQLHSSTDLSTPPPRAPLSNLLTGAALPLPRLVLEERVQAVLVSHEVDTASAGVSAGVAGL